MSLTSAPATDAGNTLTDEQMQQLMDSMQVETETDAPAETEAEAPAAE